jgi:hypothetical protein
MNDGTLFPHHFSANRKGGDHIELELWNEDGTHVGTVSLTHATALDALAALAPAIAANPYAR